MSYSIVTADLFPADSRVSQTTEVDVQSFLANGNTLNRIDYNLRHKWAWDIRGLDGYESDAICVFINYHRTM